MILLIIQLVKSTLGISRFGAADEARRLTDKNGEQVNLHDFCEAPAVWIIKTAGW